MLVLSSSTPQGEVEIGSSVVLTCVSTLHSELESVVITWGGPQTISTSDDSKYKIVEESSGLVYSSDLTVLDVREEDEGVYVCTVVDISSLQISATNSISISVVGE